MLGVGIAGLGQRRDFLQRQRVVARVVGAGALGEACHRTAVQAQREQDRNGQFSHCLVRNGPSPRPYRVPARAAYFQLTLPSPSTATLRFRGLPYTVTEPMPDRFRFGVLVRGHAGVAQARQFDVDAVGLELLRVQAAQAAQLGLQPLGAPAQGHEAGAAAG
jgi:hypothetical protein